MTGGAQSRRRSALPLPVGAFLIVAAVFIALKLIRPVVPHSVILLYMAFVVLGVVIHVTLDDDRIRRFWRFFVPADGESPALRVERWAILAVLPLIATWGVYDSLRPQYTPPVEIFHRHPTAVEEVLGRIQVPEWAANPAQWRGEDVAEGKRLYQANCAVCHGKNLDGKGPAAGGFRYPIRPANFRDVGTIAQLTMRYVYWRLTTGGIQNQFNSAMPRWVASADKAQASTLHSYDLTPEEAWKVIIYLYRESGHEPRKE